MDIEVISILSARMFAKEHPNDLQTNTDFVES